jgi:hypothetical protein
MQAGKADIENKHASKKKQAAAHTKSNNWQTLQTGKHADAAQRW